MIQMYGGLRCLINMLDGSNMAKFHDEYVSEAIAMLAPTQRDPRDTRTSAFELVVLSNVRVMHRFEDSCVGTYLHRLYVLWHRVADGGRSFSSGYRANRWRRSG